MPWQSYAALVLMLCACRVFALAVGRPNPFSFGGANNPRFDPASPGLARFMRHPILFALALWALGHLVANGDLAHAFLFGIFFGFASRGGWLVDRRKRQDMGPRWETLWREVTARPISLRIFPGTEAVLRGANGVLLYCALIAAHPWVFGVSPLP